LGSLSTDPASCQPSGRFGYLWHSNIGICFERHGLGFPEAVVDNERAFGGAAGCVEPDKLGVLGHQAELGGVPATDTTEGVLIAVEVDDLALGNFEVDVRLGGYSVEPEVEAF